KPLPGDPRFCTLAEPVKATPQASAELVEATTPASAELVEATTPASAELVEATPNLSDFTLQAGQALRRDIEALQEGGVDGIMLSNEGSIPWMTNPPTITATSMAAQIGIARSAIHIPFGVHVIWGPKATLDLAAAVDADYGWEVFTGVYASDFGLWNTNMGETARHRRRVGASNVRLFFEVVPEAAVYLGGCSIIDQVRSTIFNALPDALCVAGLKPGEPADLEVVSQIKTINSEVPVLVSTGVKENTVAEQLAVADGAIVGSALKKDGNLWNHVDVDRVRSFMRVVRSARA
ncbi:MAG: BtpA/SgcQ family protein, partial [Chloroflexi bacterium]|nr:BtpA/SgcQ family protein [Chloroflexota bacterium]